MIYHIMVQDKFIDDFIEDVYKLGLQESNKFFIRGNEGDTKYITTKRKVHFIGSDNRNINELLGSIEENSIIFVHYYDYFIANILKKYNNRLFVMLWGGEFYEEPFWHNSGWLFDKLTLNYLLKSNNVSNNCISKKLFLIKRKKLEKKSYIERIIQIHKIDNLIINKYAQTEFNFLRKLFFEPKFKFSDGFYNLNFDYASTLNTKNALKITKKIKILLGNSATETNNHLDAMEFLKFSKSELYVPLSYGVPEYQNFIIEKGKLLFEDNFFPINNYLDRFKYVDFLNSMDVIVMYHNRQQAWGNIVTCLTLGKPIFLKKNNPLWDNIINMGLMCYDIKDFYNYDLLELIQIEGKKRINNIEILKKIFSEEIRLIQLGQLLNDD